MGRRDRLLRSALRERFIITLKGGQAFDGLLIDVDDKCVIVSDGWAIDSSGRTEVDGNLFVPRNEIAYMQTALK